MLEKIDILVVHYNKDYIGGDLFDDFEYYRFLKNHTEMNVKFVTISNKNTKRALIDKYNVSVDDVEFVVTDNIKLSLSVGIAFKYNPKIIFSTSSLGLLNFMKHLESNNIITPYNKIITIINGTCDYNKRLINSVSQRTRNNLFILGDERTYEYYDDLIDESYRRGIYFDIFKPVEPVKVNTSLLNMHTPHKHYTEEQVVDCIKEYNIENMLIYCHEDNLIQCSRFRVDGVNIKVLLPPVENLVDMFDKYIYIPVERKWDVSPRLMPECKWMGKGFEYHNLGIIRDGSYYRYLDTRDDFDGLFLKEGDPIINLLYRYL